MRVGLCESWAPKNWCFWTVVLEKILESPLDCREIQPVHSEGDQPWDSFGRNDAEAETPVLWPPHAKSWLIRKNSDAESDWGQEEKGTTEDETVGWHHQLYGHEFGCTLGVDDGQGGLAYCNSWGHKELDMTEQLNWTEVVASYSKSLTWPSIITFMACLGFDKLYGLYISLLLLMYSCIYRGFFFFRNSYHVIAEMCILFIVYFSLFMKVKQWLLFSHSFVSDSLLPPWTAALRVPLSSAIFQTSFRVSSNSCLSSRWCHPTISSSADPSPVLSLSQHKSLFQWVSSSHQVTQVLVLQLQHQSFQWIFRVDFL